VRQCGDVINRSYQPAHLLVLVLGLDWLLLLNCRRTAPLSSQQREAFYQRAT